MRERRAPRWFDVPVCCDCRRELRDGDAKVSAGTGWRCSDCEYDREHERPCTCTIACIPQGLVGGQTCRLALDNRSAVKVPA